jgi:hypothetical protein
MPCPISAMLVLKLLNATVVNDCSMQQGKHGFGGIYIRAKRADLLVKSHPDILIMSALMQVQLLRRCESLPTYTILCLTTANIVYICSNSSTVLQIIRTQPRRYLVCSYEFRITLIKFSSGLSFETSKPPIGSLYEPGI